MVVCPCHFLNFPLLLLCYKSHALICNLSFQGNNEKIWVVERICLCHEQPANKGCPRFPGEVCKKGLVNLFMVKDDVMELRICVFLRPQSQNNVITTIRSLFSFGSSLLSRSR